MTKIAIKKENGHIVDVRLNGHTGYAKQGKDIVCAALSGIVQTAALGLIKVLNIALMLERDEKTGSMHFAVPVLDEKTRYGADAVLETMLQGICDLQRGYPQHINLEVI